MRILRRKFLSYDHAKDRFLDDYYDWLCWWLRIGWKKRIIAMGWVGLSLDVLAI